MQRNLALLTALAIGLLLNSVVKLSSLAGFDFVTNILLGIGLYGAVAGIDPKEFSNQRRVVFSAVTVGVLLKAAIISLVAYLFGGIGLAAIAFGAAMAQIDPLAVAALSDEHGKRLTPSGLTVLRAWSSFDDPMTVLLLLMVAIPLMGGGDFSSSGYFIGVAINLGFAGIIWGIKRLGAPHTALLVVAIVAGAAFQLPLGIAIVGLFLRPSLGKALDHAVIVALGMATLILGNLLSDGINLPLGLVLALGTHIAQILAAIALTRQMPRKDKWYLAFGQQSGITAIILAVILEQHLPGAAGTIAPAIVFINIIHWAATKLLDRKFNTIN